MNSTIMDWIQALSSIVAVIVSFVAYRIAKSALEVSKSTLQVSKDGMYLTKEISHNSYRCIIYPESFNLKDGKWCVKFRNNGFGLAFDVKVLIFVRSKEGMNGEPEQKVASGSKVINPNSEQIYVVDEYELSLFIFDKTPVTISWKTLSGVEYEAQWIWSQSPDGEPSFLLLKEIIIE